MEIHQHQHPAVLSLSLVNEVFEYIHSDFKSIIYRQGNAALFDNDDDGGEGQLSISLILNSGLEDYFSDVLLCDRFKDRLCRICAKEGQLESLKWARENGCTWDRHTCYVAAEAGHLHILQWAQEHGCPWNSATCYVAAKLNLQVKI